MVSIRQARKDEVWDLQVLNDAVFVDNSKYDDDLDLDWAKSDKGKSYFTSLLNKADSICLIAEEDGDKVGYIAAEEPADITYLKSRYIEIENMGVLPSHQSKGIGSKLMQECLNLARNKGFQKAYVNAYFKNLRAIDFYKKNGFSEIDTSLERKI
jgi:ribosomal protein S18 acetylase RimI-like enzyme